MKSFFRINVPTFALLGFFLFIRSTFANEYVVPSGSMEPTIAIGDRIFVNRVAFDLKLPLTNTILKKIDEPKRGSIVVFESPEKPGLVLVKRMVAVPGDEVEIRDGNVTINGKPGEFESHVQRIPEMFRPDHFKFRVPKDHYFMMGDNRDNSADSRVFGFVPRQLLIGEATRVVFSVDFNQPWDHMFAWSRFGKSLIE